MSRFLLYYHLFLSRVWGRFSSRFRGSAEVQSQCSGSGFQNLADNILRESPQEQSWAQLHKSNRAYRRKVDSLLGGTNIKLARFTIDYETTSRVYKILSLECRLPDRAEAHKYCENDDNSCLEGRSASDDARICAHDMALRGLARN